MIRLCGLALVAGAAYFILAESGWRGARTVPIAAFIFIFGSAVASAVRSADTLSELIADGGLPTDYASLLLRAIGIVYAAEAASETCRSLGADACAAAIDLACRAELFVLVLPVMGQLFSISLSLL